MKHSDLLTALSLTLGTGGIARGIALKSYRQIAAGTTKLVLRSTATNQISTYEKSKTDYHWRDARCRRHGG